VGMFYSCLGSFFILILSLWSPIHFGYRPPTSKILDGIISAHKKVDTLGTYVAGI
jgi:hypothetical protein